MLEYGTRVVAGVVPGKGGQTFDDAPNAGLPYRAPDQAADARAIRVAEEVVGEILTVLPAPA